MEQPNGCQDRVGYRNRVAVLVIWYDSGSRWHGASSRLDPAIAIAVVVPELCIHQIKRVVRVLGSY
jgi:hypothetical protein